MKIIDTLYTWYGKRNVRIVLGAIALLVVVALVTGKSDEEVTSESDSLPIVSVATPAEMSGEQSLQLIGTVRSVTEATIDSELSSRVTAVYAELGQKVQAGSVIAQLENASEYASLLQAEGAYEAALAVAAQSDSSLQSAETALQSAQNNALTAYKNAYTTASGIVYGDIDTFYRNPQSSTPSLRMSTEGKGAYLRDERVALEAIFDQWQASTVALTTSDDLSVALKEAEMHTARITNLIDTFITLTNDSDVEDDVIDGVAVGTLTPALVAQRGVLNNTQNTLQSAASGLTNAANALTQAEIASTQGTDYSAANAQVKQALGSLRAAQANYEKTLLRSPISGVLQNLSVQQGDFVSGFQTIAKVVGDGGLEVTTYVGDRERNLLSVGTEVTLENGATGVITNIAPAVDAVTKKTEVRIGTNDESITNGQTVRITLMQEMTSEEVIVPLAAVKLSADAAAVFIVEDGTLIAKPVTLGDVRGTTVVIESGLASTDSVVTDVRGFATGQAVEIK